MKNYNGLRWTARITGTLFVLLTFAMLIIIFTVGKKGTADMDFSLITPRIAISVTLWCVSAAALILAFRYEGLGGGISLLCNFGIAIFGLLNDKEPAATLLSFLVLSIPALLYLSYWFVTKRNNGNPEPANAV
jgi:hypothetical protein